MRPRGENIEYDKLRDRYDRLKVAVDELYTSPQGKIIAERDALAVELQGTKDELYSVDKAAKELGAELAECRLQRDSWKRIAESGLGVTSETPT
jgi:hypothetical protein